MNTKQQTIQTYNDTAEAMAEKFAKIGARVVDIDRAFDFVQKENPFVLEIGCGTGRDAAVIATRTNHFIGIDASKSMVELTRAAAPSGTFEVQDVETYEFPNGIDIIFSFASLLHSNRDRVKDILDRAYAALNEGGIFYISLKHGDYHEKTKTDEFGTRTYFYYTPELIRELAGERYNVIYEDVHELLGQTWMAIVLQRPRTV